MSYFFVNYVEFLKECSLDEFPCALGGCQNEGTSFECCEHNITVFDGKDEPDSVVEFEGEFVKIHHGSFDETRLDVLSKFVDMKIILDEKWDLKIFLSKIQEKKEKIFSSLAKSCLVESAVYATKTKEGIKNSDSFVSAWLKSSAYFLADAIFFANKKRPSPTHMLDVFRTFPKNQINENLSLVTECVGIERATPSLLGRMCKSTIGFSDMVEKNNNSKIIKRKYDYFIKNSLFSDCYFYLAYVNRDNFMKIKNLLNRKPEYFHVLKIGFDFDNDLNKIEQQAELLHKTANKLVSIL